MVLQPPAFLAIRQQSRFSSSEVVTAIIKSAVSMPASFCTVKLAPFPTTPITSNRFATDSAFLASRSTTVILCPSLLNCSVKVVPTFPQPTMIICIFPTPYVRYLSFFSFLLYFCFLHDSGITAAPPKAVMGKLLGSPIFTLIGNFVPYWETSPGRFYGLAHFILMHFAVIIIPFPKKEKGFWYPNFQ